MLRGAIVLASAAWFLMAAMIWLILLPLEAWAEGDD